MNFAAERGRQAPILPTGGRFLPPRGGKENTATLFPLPSFWGQGARDGGISPAQVHNTL